MAKSDTKGPKPRLPRGFMDARAAEIRLREEVLSKIRAVYELYGFEALETPALEYTECLGKFLPDVERPEGGVFSLRDDDEAWMSLRYDLTAPLARFVAENFDALPKPFRRYQLGPVWRNEKPGPGRFRQFYQFDADTVGSASPAADAELMMMLADVLEALGLERGQYIVNVNSRQFLERCLDNAEVDISRRGMVLRALDKWDRLGVDGVRALLGAGRKDESGDFTRGAELTVQQIDRVLNGVAPLPSGAVAGVGGAPSEFSEVFDLVRACGYQQDRVRYDPSIIRGLEYYTGMVFEAQVTFPVTNERGETVVFGSVAGGGRYDDLVARFIGQKVPATGVSIGVSRLVTALRTLRSGAAQAETGPVVVLVLDGETARAQGMVAELRRAKIRAELYLGGAGMRAQLKYADKRQAPIAVIEGGDERAKGEVVLKDLILGADMAKAIEGNKAWREDQPAQTSVLRGSLVQGVRAMLERQRARD